MARREIYVSTDVEADGPIPGPHSMLSFGSVAFGDDGAVIATYSANLATLDGATAHPDTMTWWQSQPAAWAACRADVRAPEVVMPEYAAWVEALPGRPVFVAFPAGFDFTFVYWYLMRFAGRSPYSHSALDVKSYAAALLGTRYRDTAKRVMPARWLSARPHTHVALEDALEQGEMFAKMLAEARARPRE
ncbi:MAG: exonuclease [Deltaproteobacteria bacterium]|nr:exonuclease [Deltaproteobacteria bacterium]